MLGEPPLRVITLEIDRELPKEILVTHEFLANPTSDPRPNRGHKRERDWDVSTKRRRRR